MYFGSLPTEDLPLAISITKRAAIENGFVIDFHSPATDMSSKEGMIEYLTKVNCVIHGNRGWHFELVKEQPCGYIKTDRTVYSLS
tara:strand:+ start:904 stop:1158 length:255 start_codon:yes stop_codon:yes gene_type:complete